MVNNEAIIAELGNHPYTPEDKITFGGASHYCKVFKLGSGKIEIVYKSGNAGAICEAMSTTECIDKNGIIVDGTDVYVLKETSPRGTFARYVVLETNTGMQLKGIVDASSISLTKGQSIGAINGGASSSTLPSAGDYKGQIATCENGTAWIWNGAAWVASAGSGNLPTPASNQKGTNLIINSAGNAWEVNPIFRSLLKTNGIAGIDGGGYIALKLYTITEQSGAQNTSFDLIVRNHSQTSIRYHVTIMSKTTTTAGVTAINSMYTEIAEIPATNSYGNFVDFKPEIKYNGADVYVVVWAPTRWAVNIVPFNFYMTDSHTLTYDMSSSVVNDQDVIASFTSPNAKYNYIVVPKSTSNNQLLVSDGTTGRWKTINGGTSGQILAMTDNGIAWIDAV